MLELRKQIEKQSSDLGNATRTVTELRSKVTELEDKLMSNNKELHAAQDLNQALQHEFKVRPSSLFVSTVQLACNL